MKSLHEVRDADMCHPGPPSRKDFLPQVLGSCQKTTFSLGMFRGTSGARSLSQGRVLPEGGPCPMTHQGGDRKAQTGPIWWEIYVLESPS